MQITIHTPTSKLVNSTEYYTKLGFQDISEGDQILFTEGTSLIEVNPDRYARAGIRLYKPSWEAELEQLKNITHVTQQRDTYLFSDPSGIWIYLTEAEFQVPYDLTGSSTSILGNFAGITLESTDIKRSSDIYKLLGFKVSAGEEEQGFISFSHNGFNITILGPLKCPHLFFNPSLTFFNGANNLAIIEKVRDLGIPITEEITYFNNEGVVDNIIIRDPGGYGFFIFND